MANNVASDSMQGARLEFVLRKLTGTVEHPQALAPQTEKYMEKHPEEDQRISNVITMVTVAAGYMVFFPNGSCYRLSEKEMHRRKFSRPPKILNFDAAKDTETPAGRFKFAITDADRQKAYREMEQEIINRCLGRNGSIISMVSNYNPQGELVAPKAEKKVA